MLITFSSDSYENIVMFEEVAKSLLRLMGHSATVPGALLAEEISPALERLELGLKKTPQSTQQDDEQEVDVSLSQRAFPLINMLRSAIKNQSNVMWK